MGIGSVTSTSGMSGMQMTMARSIDLESKSIQNEITGVQQKMTKLSTEEELSVDEKMNERKQLQKEITSLNVELKQRQEELRRSQRREMMMAQLQEEKELSEEEKSEDKIQDEDTSLYKSDEKKLPTDKTQLEEANETKEDMAEEEAKDIESDADTGLSPKKMHAIVSADTSIQRSDRQGTVITRIKGGVVILKGEMNQDEIRGIDTENKQAELQKMEEKEQRARAFQASILGEANSIMKSAAKEDLVGTQDRTKVNTENNVVINAFQLSKEEQASQQSLNISLGN